MSYEKGEQGNGIYPQRLGLSAVRVELQNKKNQQHKLTKLFTRAPHF
jgi:hypothetical protein|tara:strand:+ start:533 stop:673 length:141 start_codon:yes stop_codon:yes gene_type:complete